MRRALAVATILLVLLTAAAPHAHGGPLGDHGCFACVTAGGEEASPSTPAPAPPEHVTAAVPVEAPCSPVTGAPLGAIPGQSPPAGV